ncbi:DUF6624 domain-containing protein [Mucilaginibacter sp.]
MKRAYYRTFSRFENNFNFKKQTLLLIKYTSGKVLLCVLLLITSSQLGLAQKIKYNKHLSEQIDSLKNEDQKPASIQNGKEAETAFKKVILTNFPLVKKILDSYGFPGYNLVGIESSNNYWILVQHSDFNLSFQKRAQKLMAKEVKRRNASNSYYAYLVDRIAINEGKKQVYGSQIQMTDKGYQPKPLIDSLNVDERRKKIGLAPLSEYLIKANETFNEMNKGRGHIAIKGIDKDTIKP